MSHKQFHKRRNDRKDSVSHFWTFSDKFTKNNVFWSCDLIFTFLQFSQKCARVYFEPSGHWVSLGWTSPRCCSRGSPGGWIKIFFCKYKVYTRGHIPKHKKTLKLRVQGLKFKTTPDLLTPVPRTLEYFCGIVFLQYYIHLSKTQYIQPRTNIFYNNRLHVLKNTLNSRVLSCSGICPLLL